MLKYRSARSMVGPLSSAVPLYRQAWALPPVLPTTSWPSNLRLPPENDAGTPAHCADRGLPSQRGHLVLLMLEFMRRREALVLRQRLH